MKNKNKKRKPKKEKVLVTGATGFVGSHICDALIEKGYEVFGLSYGGEEKVKHLKKNKKFKLIKGDITNFGEILKIFKKIKPKGIFHIAALHSPIPIDNPFPFFEPNIRGTLNLLEACRLQKVKKFIYSSSMSVYGLERKYLPVDEKHPTAPYDFYSLTKLIGEEFCQFYAKQYDLNAIILRYVGVYGPRRDWGAFANFVRRAVKNKPLNILSNISWDVVYAEDIAQANITAFLRAEKMGFKIINVGTGKEVNIKELAEKIIKISGSKSKVELAKDFPASPSSHFYYNIAKAKKLLNFSPRSINKGLSQYIKNLKI